MPISVPSQLTLLCWPLCPLATHREEQQSHQQTGRDSDCRVDGERSSDSTQTIPPAVNHRHVSNWEIVGCIENCEGGCGQWIVWVDGVEGNRDAGGYRERLK